MYTKEQEEQALAEFERTGSAIQTVRQLGYPTLSTLYRWFERRKAGLENNHGHVKLSTEESPHRGCTETHPRHPSAQQKLDILYRCFEIGEDVEFVSRETGYSRVSIYKWRRQYLEKGVLALMPSSKDIARKKGILSEQKSEQSQKSMTEMQKQMHDMQLEIDILKETINVLNPGADITEVSNREKMQLVDALKMDYPLHELLTKLHFSRSSYYYQIKARSLPYKYAALQERINAIFSENHTCYGYRRVHAALRSGGISVSEKVVRKVMAQCGLITKRTSRKRYSSYLGEIDKGAENLISRDFHANIPNEKWLTDITEFAIPAGKIYLSPMIDCFDGMIVSSAIGTSPNAALVNHMLDNAVASLTGSQHPIVHTDRGCHYRWPGWITRMDQAHLTRSMSKKGCSPDNSACEGFFGRMKNEMFYGRSWAGVSTEEFIDMLNHYLQWYNKKRIKLSLGAMSPLEYRHSLGLVT